MAIVGQQLLTPEAGYKRIGDNDPLFSTCRFGTGWYYANNANCYSGGFYVSFNTSDYLAFNFTGNKLRGISINAKDWAFGCNLYIDDILMYSWTQNVAEILYQGVIFDFQNLSDGEHSAKITWAGGTFGLDAIDIDSTGTIKPYNPYNPNPTPSISAPTNLIATAGDSQVTLSWTAVTDATGYNVKRSTTAGGPYTKTIATNVTGTSYVDSTASNGTTYYYVVTALNDASESANSNEASATPNTSTPIPTPTGNSLLRVTMSDSSEREYRLSIAEIDGFVNWYTRTIGTGISCYALNDIVDNSKEYLAFEKIISFKVIPIAK